MESPVKLGGRRRPRRRPSARSVKPVDYGGEQDGGVWPFTPSRRSTRMVSFDDLTTEKTPLRPRASASVSKRSQRYTTKVVPETSTAKRSRLATTESQTLQQEYLNQLELAEAELVRIQQTIKAAKEAGKTSPNKGTVLSTLLVLNESILIQLMKRMKSMNESTQEPFIHFLIEIYDRLKTLESVAKNIIVNKDLENRIQLNRHIVGVFLGKESASSGEQLGAGFVDIFKKFITVCSGGLCRRVEVESPKAEAEPPKQASLFEIIKSSLEDYGEILNNIEQDGIAFTNETNINKKIIVLRSIRIKISSSYRILDTAIDNIITIGVKTQQVPLTTEQKTLLNDSIQEYITILETLNKRVPDNDTKKSTKISTKISIKSHIDKLNKIKEHLTSTTSVRQTPPVSAAPASNKKKQANTLSILTAAKAQREAASAAFKAQREAASAARAADTAELKAKREAASAALKAQREAASAALKAQREAASAARAAEEARLKQEAEERKQRIADATKKGEAEGIKKKIEEIEQVLSEGKKQVFSKGKTYSSSSQSSLLGELDKLIEEEEKQRSSPGTSSPKTGGRKKAAKATRVKRI